MFITLKKSLQWVPIAGWVCIERMYFGIGFSFDVIGYAIFQLYISGALVGFRSAPFSLFVGVFG
jgi:hypothetical protein